MWDVDRRHIGTVRFSGSGTGKKVWRDVEGVESFRPFYAPAPDGVERAGFAALGYYISVSSVRSLVEVTVHPATPGFGSDTSFFGGKT